MKNLSSGLLFLSLFISVGNYAQYISPCTYTSAKSGVPQKLSYSISKSNPDPIIYTTSYLVLDKSGIPYKIFKVSNNTRSREVNILMLDGRTGGKDEEYTTSYSEFGGLILYPEGDSVTYLVKPYEYLFLLSFEDEKKQFINLHFVTKIADYTIQFSVVSDSLLRKNREMLQQLALYKVMLDQQEVERRLQEEKLRLEEAQQRRIDSVVEAKVKAALANSETLSRQAQQRVSDSLENALKNQTKPISDNLIIVALDSLCRQFINDSLHIVQITATINDEITKHGGQESDIKGESRYMGDKKGQSWQGTGLMIVGNRKVYNGHFENDQFVDGTVLLRYESGNKYVGYYKQARPWGFGQLTYSNGDLTSGYFGENGFEKGISKRKEKDGSYYFGFSDMNKKEGFGIFVAANGNQYIGVFKNDKLQNGYSSQTDDVGSKMYFETRDFNKYPIDFATWKKFADEYFKVKTSYHM